MAWQDLFPAATPAEWRDWRWQQRHALVTEEELARVVRLSDAERRGLRAAEGWLRVGVTPYYASLMDPAHPSCPIRMQAIPSALELERAPGDLEDPLGEEPRRAVPAVVHRYADRVLLLVGDRCAVYCRHCTRRRMTLAGTEGIERSAIDEGIAYIRAHPEVRDVILSGGDPLSLSDERLEEILSALRTIPHVQLVRIGTRAPVTIPMRVTDALAALLRRHAPLFVVTHFNHPRECTPEAREACERLVDHGVPVENQSVLLRGVNSSARLIADLNRTLLTFRVRPYYLHQGDLAGGTAHLRTPLAAGLAIVEELRGRVSGLAIPHLAVDLPGGLGKVTLAPEYRIAGPAGAATETSPGAGTGAAAPAGDATTPPGAPQGAAPPTPGTWFRNHRGETSFYPEPPESDCACPYEQVYYAAPDRGPDGPRRGPTTG